MMDGRVSPGHSLCGKLLSSISPQARLTHSMSSDLNFYIFREGRRQIPGQRLLAELRESLARAVDDAGWTDALLRSGELESALADGGLSQAEAQAKITDSCAESMVAADHHPKAELLRRLPEGISGELTVATPEGFAYYALHPRQYADVVERCGDIKSAVIVGIRSIGTTLSAMAAAALRQRGSKAVRLTVRPEGHPFERQVSWTPAQATSIGAGMVSGATFVVVDEGPGLSGSSFLAVAEALVAAGVGREQIVLVPGYAVDPSRLRARDAERRWSEFRCVPAKDAPRPSGEWIGAGEWRPRFLGDERHWPGAWTNLERSKFLSEDGRTLWKFEGLGPYGERSRTQARRLAENGFGPRVLAEESGYVGYERLRGTPARREDLEAERIRRIASYCAFRAKEFEYEVSEGQQQDLSTMGRVNFEREFGEPLPEQWTRLEIVKPTICDAKMSPQEWLLTEDGRFLKVDATSHGDDHFFPGPCDIAWDLAGAMVEWEMDAVGRNALLREYQHLSKDDASGRIANYLRAYAVFRFAWAKMGAAAMKGTPEEERLMREYRRYRAHAEGVGAASAHS